MPITGLGRERRLSRQRDGCASIGVAGKERSGYSALSIRIAKRVFAKVLTVGSQTVSVGGMKQSNQAIKNPFPSSRPHQDSMNEQVQGA